VLDLVYKDIIQGRRTILWYLVTGTILGLVMMVGVTNVGSILATMMLFSVYGYAVRSTYDEDKNGALLFLKGLPLSDTAIVCSKYLSTLVVAVFLGVFFQGLAALSEGVIAPGLGLGPAAKACVDTGTLLRNSLGNAAIAFGVTMVMLSIYLTMFFCMGYARAAAYNRFVMLGLFAFVFAAASVVQRLSPEPPGWVIALGQSPWTPLLAAAVGLGIYALGCVASVMRVHTKDWT